MCGGKELDIGENAAQYVDDLPLPARMQVYVELINEDEARCLRDSFGEEGIQRGHAVGDVEDHPDQGLVACTQYGDGDDGTILPVHEFLGTLIVEDVDRCRFQLRHCRGNGMLDGFVFPDGLVGLPGNLFHAGTPFEHQLHAGFVAHAVDVAGDAAGLFARKGIRLFLALL